MGSNIVVFPGARRALAGEVGLEEVRQLLVSQAQQRFLHSITDLVGMLGLTGAVAVIEATLAEVRNAPTAAQFVCASLTGSSD